MVQVDGEKYPLGLGGPATKLVVITFAMLFIATALVSNRIVYRIQKAGYLGWDDKTIVIALALLFLQSGAIVTATSFGYGFDSPLVEPETRTNALIAFWLYQIVYKLANNTVKISILLQFIRVFAVAWFQRFCTGMITLCAMAAVSFTATTIFQCTPIESIWNRTPDAYCINIAAFWTSNAVWNIVSDLLLLFGPVYWILRLQVSKLKKALVFCNFSFGLFVLVASICRLTTLNSSAHKSDPLSGTLISTIWTQAETSVAVICTCIPMIRPVLARCIPALRESRPSAAVSRAIPDIQPPILLKPLPTRRMQARDENVGHGSGTGPRGLVPRAYPIPEFPYPPPGVGYYDERRLLWESSQTSLIAKGEESIREDAE